MDKYRPKRPTSLNLFPQLPQAGTQDSINNNSLGKKDSWKDSHSSSPHITGDPAPQDAKPKPEEKVRPTAQRRPAPKPPTASNSRNNAQATASAPDTRVRPRERSTSAATQPCSTPRSQRRAAGGGGGGRGGGGRGAMKEKNLGELRGNGTDRRGGRLCEDKAKDKDRNGHQRQREVNGPKGRQAEGRGRGGSKMSRGGAGIKSNNKLSNQEIYLPAMVVPRTPVAARSQEKSQNREKSQNQGQNHDRTQENPPAALSRSSSEGGSNRMSLSSDTEGPPPGPLHPSLSCRTNPDIREEDGEGDPTPSASVQNHPARTPTDKDKPETDRTTAETDAGGDKAEDTVDVKLGRTRPKSETAVGLSYDSVKYTLVVDEHVQLELGKLKDCLHGPNEHNEDSDTETVYQSANEEEDPEYEEERRKSEEARKLERRKEEEKQRQEEKKRKKEEEEAKRRKEEDLKKRREEEVKRRREVVAVARVCKQSKVSSATTSEEDESSGGGRGPRSRKFLNLFSANSSSSYSSTGAGSFGVFSCVLDGVERQQSHRATYRFVPRHADELQLETDDPVLMLKQSEDLWCQGYNMRTGATGIFPAFYAVRVPKDGSHVRNDGWAEQFVVRFLGSVQVPIHMGNDVLCAAMQKVVCNRRSAGQLPSACVLEVSVKGVKMIVQDQCHSVHRGDQCFHFFQLKNISFCGCHPKHSRYFGFITKHPDQQRFACHVLMSDTTLHPLAESVRRAFQQFYKEHIGYSCPTEDIFIE
ncbi:C-Jun-amino-terminal kinase-interacting protein 1-like isoform X2 [Xiphophorus hellerii]|uniref:C-Jun-amino-terminal kinase-interacting protein 1-like isoform X2 n=1 Tax=Xiphophorus hellerii TaxID=8084 RepID=UPI0013B419D2|nr:C-Jun-amino-terminal kinase-interacting protein 1-like isoform X2 [Xiphophorus hellerii]